MAKVKESCRIVVRFEDVLLSEPIIVELDCNESSRLFPYYLRQKIHETKRVPPFEQKITKISNNEYSMKIRNRKNLLPLTIHGHWYDEYKLQIDKKDTVLDIKFLLAPLVNHGNKAQDIQLNYNTVRRLQDDEIVYDTNCVNNDSIVIMFWFEFENGNIGESPIYQTVSKLQTVNPVFPDIGQTVRRVLNQRKGDPNAVSFGYRKYLDKNDLSKRGDFEFITVDTVSKRIDNISVALRDLLNLSKENNSMFGLCSINRREWLFCDYACAVSSLVSVPLYPTLDANALEFITNHAQINAIGTDYKTLPQIVKLFDTCQPHLQHVILFDDELPDKLWIESKEGSELLRKYKNKIHLLSKLEETARNGIDSGKYIVKDVIPSRDDIYTIMYTSGTTGNPKGVMISHGNMMTVMNAFLTVNTEEKYPLPPGAERVHLSYLPLAHSMERMLNLFAFIKNAKIGFFRGLVDGLIEDMQLIKPPAFIAVPRIFQKVQSKIMNEMEKKNFLVRKLFDYAFKSKLDLIQQRKDLTGNIWDRLIFNKINQQFGGNIMGVGSGSAPLSEELALFLKVCLANVVAEGYGLTETTASGTGTHPYDLKFGHVGVPRIDTCLKLVDVPDMNYYTSDKPHPRGEICMKGGSIFQGYYKNAEKTNEVLSKDGWFQTGDIGEWRGEGRLVIIDRKKNIFKLSQGEYIRPEYIQNVYKMSPFIGSMFVYGDSYQNYLVAIIVPDFEALEQIDASLANIECLNDMAKYKQIENIIKEELKKEETRAKLNGFEKVRKFRLINEDFTSENGLLTASMKLKRNVAKQKFEKQIKEMYEIKSKL